MPPMIRPRVAHGTCLSPDGQYLFVAGGLGHMVGHGVCALRNCEVFDFQTGEWARLPRMIRPREGLALTISKDGKFLYAIGGKQGLTEITRSVEVLNLETRVWTEENPMNAPRGWIGTSAAISPDGSRIFAVGGTLPSSDLKFPGEEFNLSSRRWSALREKSISGKCLRMQSGLGVSFSPDGKRLYAVGG